MFVIPDSIPNNKMTEKTTYCWLLILLKNKKNLIMIQENKKEADF